MLMRLAVIVVITLCLFCGRSFADLRAGSGVINRDIESYKISYKPDSNNKDYLSYYRIIRDKLKQSLGDTCKYYFTEGDVGLMFVLNPDGSLAGFDIDNVNSTNDKKLVGMATSSLKNASPFPPFPKGLPPSQIPFNVTISFKAK